LLYGVWDMLTPVDFFPFFLTGVVCLFGMFLFLLSLFE
jgi:hypothetical protein